MLMAPKLPIQSSLREQIWVSLLLLPLSQHITETEGRDQNTHPHHQSPSAKGMPLPKPILIKSRFYTPLLKNCP